MSRSLSLTARICLAFMLVATSVISLTALGFFQLSKHHFEELDEAILNEKLHAIRIMLQVSPQPLQAEHQQQHLQAMLGAHESMRVLITRDDGDILFAEPQDFLAAASDPLISTQSHWFWQEGERFFQGLSAEIALEDSPPLRVLLALDVTAHTLFFRSLMYWLWFGMLLCLLTSALLGWLVARSGLQPLREITQSMTRISAASLDERIDTHAVPRELQAMVHSFNSMLCRLQDAFARISNFSADIAHEMRTPVSNMLTQTEVVLMRKRDADTYENNLHSNLEELSRLSRMIDDMLFLAKSENGQTLLNQQPLELDELVSGQLEYYRILAEEKGIAIEVIGQGHIHGDAPMVGRVVSNLLSNALRYTPPGQTVQIQLRQQPDSVELCVSNPGKDIQPLHLDRLFDRFYRADPARREGDSANAGLGLAIAAAIVKAHGGSIHCTSQGGITRFCVQFPRPSA